MDNKACCSPGWRREAKAGLREASSRKREDLCPARRRRSSAIMEEKELSDQRETSLT